MLNRFTYSVILFVILIVLTCCKRQGDSLQQKRIYYLPDKFVMGADLSYVNQILEHGGVYRDSGTIKDPYLIFRQYGTNVVRFRLFHNPVWTREVYSPPSEKMYNDFADVKDGIRRAKLLGMKVCLDFHYSDTWADPSKQIKPAAWQSLDIAALRDSVYNYTYKTLKELDKEGLMPEYVQPGNEINPGFLLPEGSRWNGNENNMIYLLNGAISAIRSAGNSSQIKPRIIIHVAQPENADPWFEGLWQKGLTDYDFIGLSYYYIWSKVKLEELSNYISMLKTKYTKDVMIMETAYPWTIENADNYPNIIDTGKLTDRFPATQEGQFNYLKTLVQEIIEGGGEGVFYWEPAWITSEMKDLWGTGSSWDCNTFFDFQGNTIKGINYMTEKYNIR
ncbi:MAG TPA: glycosyl hydrolase 53 family protein [Bacteroidales bacterium]|nr:glycosyl hydrolase 53 family protein [Bacteroidales bacterium]HOK73803.1 glycosyl hydrolase 53 family protein [Bacteroidales bacterium]HOM40059.1 glycosyl hydrolase 53 family protein [Bacteroidales bacterium]HOU29884.1 glycosyl hydrolase 53 family protein [Bacteroidales bacterium]HPP91756.1 glycosyl hydrolase 53 family protein [Bacteroidales bacterium]